MSYGIENGTLREPVQVMMHLPENWTKVLFVRIYGVGLAGGPVYWDIPTETIPVELRPIGSRFVLTARVESSKLEHGRAALSNKLSIDKLPDSENYLWPECNHRL